MYFNYYIDLLKYIYLCETIIILIINIYIHLFYISEKKNTKPGVRI